MHVLYQVPHPLTMHLYLRSRLPIFPMSPIHVPHQARPCSAASGSRLFNDRLLRCFAVRWSVRCSHSLCIGSLRLLTPSSSTASSALQRGPLHLAVADAVYEACVRALPAHFIGPVALVTQLDHGLAACAVFGYSVRPTSAWSAVSSAGAPSGASASASICTSAHRYPSASLSSHLARLVLNLLISPCPIPRPLHAPYLRCPASICIEPR